MSSSLRFSLSTSDDGTSILNVSILTDILEYHRKCVAYVSRRGNAEKEKEMLEDPSETHAGSETGFNGRRGYGNGQSRFKLRFMPSSQYLHP